MEAGEVDLIFERSDRLVYELLNKLIDHTIYTPEPSKPIGTEYEE